MSKQNCTSCLYMRIAVNQDKGMSKYCCLHPPVPQCVHTPNGTIVLSVQAPVPPSEWCSKWEANPPALS